MGTSSKGFISKIADFFRRILGRPVMSLSRSGHIIEELHNAARLQKEERDYIREIGYQAVKLCKDQKITDIRIAELTQKLDENLENQKSCEKRLGRFQNKGDIRDVLDTDTSNI